MTFSLMCAAEKCSKCRSAGVQVNDTVTQQFALMLEYLLGDYYFWAANVSVWAVHF